MIGMIDGPMLVGIAALITSIVNGIAVWRARDRPRARPPRPPARRADGTTGDPH